MTHIGPHTLYCGDAREILPGLDLAGASVITDPPWDQARGIPGADDPRSLFAAVAPHIARAARAVVQLGINTSPEFLAPLHPLMPFVHVCWLRYALPSYAGRTLRSADVAYAFGTPIAPRPGQTVIPTETVSTGRRAGEGGTRLWGRNRSDRDVTYYLDRAEHPMPRHLNHVLWLVRWWSEPDGVVVDPFAGSGTTGVAAHMSGRKFIGIEIEPRYFDVACRRIEEAMRQGELFTAAEIG